MQGHSLIGHLQHSPRGVGLKVSSRFDDENSKDSHKLINPTNPVLSQLSHIPRKFQGREFGLCARARFAASVYLVSVAQSAQANIEPAGRDTRREIAHPKMPMIFPRRCFRLGRVASRKA